MVSVVTPDGAHAAEDRHLGAVMDSTARRTTLVAGAALVVMATAAAGSSTRPAPCSKVHAVDREGDQRYGFFGIGTPLQPGDRSIDLRRVFFNSIDGKVTFNVQLSEVGTTVPNGVDMVIHRMIYSDPADLFLDIRVHRDGSVTYHYGETAQAGRPTNPQTTGSIHPGIDGVISVLLPPSHGGRPGTKVAGYVFSSYHVIGTPYLVTTDTIPDSGTFSYTGTVCRSKRARR